MNLNELLKVPLIIIYLKEQNYPRILSNAHFWRNLENQGAVDRTQSLVLALTTQLDGRLPAGGSKSKLYLGDCAPIVFRRENLLLFRVEELFDVCSTVCGYSWTRSIALYYFHLEL
jgi:hypothetical protein